MMMRSIQTTHESGWHTHHYTTVYHTSTRSRYLISFFAAVGLKATYGPVRSGCCIKRQTRDLPIAKLHTVFRLRLAKSIHHESLDYVL
jgi:hypothetical protein